MSTKTYRWILVLIAGLFVVVTASLSLPARVSAEKMSGTADNSCLACHENLYYLHDMGKHYCITEHKDRCVDCHTGNATAMQKEESHVGLCGHPQENNGARCQECHTPQDARIRLAEFASVGGFNTIIKANTYTPSVQVASDSPNVSEVNPLQENFPWVAGAIVLFGLWLILVHFSPLKP